VAAAVVYSRHYDITFFGIERLHPFDSRKYGRAWRALLGQFGRGLDARRLTPSGPVSDADLRSVHTDPYLDTHLRSPAYLARALEVPPVARAPRWLIDWRVLRPMRWATAGTILAAREALRSGGVVMNLTGGYHHAGPNRGEGFCLYADVGIAVAVLRRDGVLAAGDRVLYVDLDAHQAPACSPTTRACSSSTSTTATSTRTTRRRAAGSTATCRSPPATTTHATSRR
jgi:histone deacetylase 11